MHAALPGFHDVLDAAARIAVHAHATPVLRSRALDEAAEEKIYDRLVAQVRRAGGALVSIAHRPALGARHDKRWTLEKAPDGATALYRLRQATG